MTSKTQSDKDRVVIFDTTLRDGEQCPGATMTHEEKLEVAELLDTMGVDIIEAGFPIASEGDFAAVNDIAKRAKNSVICGLSRASPKDIDRCAEAIRPAKRRRIHTFLSTSPVHMKWKLQKEPHEVYEMVIAQVARARALAPDIRGGILFDRAVAEYAGAYADLNERDHQELVRAVADGRIVAVEGV